MRRQSYRNTVVLAAVAVGAGAFMAAFGGADLTMDARLTVTR